MMSEVQENGRGQGRLKIFLGMAAGVGKTYTMLEAAQQKKLEGVHVVIGTVDTHGRVETAKLLESLQVIPEKKVVYKEKEFKELALDEIIRIKPRLVLVDELAHSNLPGSKHVKRWQDVMEILENGIDVYTTVNIQHIESYKDVIEGITGIKIRETVPDLMLSQASEIECVDITPAELLQRLKEGKVYTGEFSTIALQNFFQEDRLTALREIALRFTAEKVDQELHQMFVAARKDKIWRPRERLLVAINHELYAQYLIRATRRLAFTLHAPWLVVYVDRGENLNDVESASLTKNFALARDLGAEVITTQDINVAEAIQRIAEQEEVTQIIIGKSVKKKFSHLFCHSLADKLSKLSSGIDVLIMRHPAILSPKKREFKARRFFSGLIPFKRRHELLVRRERSTQAIYEMIREISSAPTSAYLFEAIKKKLGKILQGSCEIVVQKLDGGLNYEGAPTIAQDEKEKGVATWVYENGKEAGWSTFTLPASQFLYIPLKGFKEIVGVLAFRPMSGKSLLPEERNFLYTVGQQFANFLERSFVEERELRNQFIRQLEQVYAKVLQSISDELYHPLMIIQNAIIDFRDERVVTENLRLYTSVHQIEKTSESLMRIAENAKAMAKLSGGVIGFKKSYHDIAEWIHTCCEEMQTAFKNHRLKVQIPPQAPLVPFDLTLLTILLRHLLFNAIEYSPPQSTIEIEAELYNGTFALSVSDGGKGIPEDVMDLVFEKFYRVEGTASTGLGLGLAIVKSIADIHHGIIKVHNRPTGGTTFSLILPLS